MADDGNTNDDGTNDDGTDQDGGGGDSGQDGGSDGHDGQGGRDLSTASNAELQDLVRKTRREAGTYRTKFRDAEGKLGTLQTSHDGLETKVTDLEDAQKTDEEKREARNAALEEEAGKVPDLNATIKGAERYVGFVKDRLDAEMERIDALDDAQKGPYTQLLDVFQKDDHLGRLNAVMALKAAEGTSAKVPPGDNKSPAETGGGASDSDAKAKLGNWSASGLAETQAVDKLLNPE